MAPAALLGVGLVAFFAFDLDDYLTFEMLRDNRAQLLASVERMGLAGVGAFIAGYAVAVAFSLPIGAILTIVAGFFFGPVTGTVAAVLGATIGGTVVFVAARTALGEALRAKAGSGIEKMARGFEEDAFSYLLTLRLVPVFPFWLVNIVPAFTRIRLRTYVAATALGIVPGTLVYVLVGNGLGAVFEAGETPDLGIIFEPVILAPVIGLALLSLLPPVYRHLRRRRRRSAPGPGRERTGQPAVRHRDVSPCGAEDLRGRSGA